MFANGLAQEFPDNAVDTQFLMQNPSIQDIALRIDKGSGEGEEEGGASSFDLNASFGLRSIMALLVVRHHIGAICYPETKEVHWIDVDFRFRPGIFVLLGAVSIACRSTTEASWKQLYRFAPTVYFPYWFTLLLLTPIIAITCLNQGHTDWGELVYDGLLLRSIWDIGGGVFTHMWFFTSLFCFYVFYDVYLLVLNTNFHCIRCCCGEQEEFADLEDEEGDHEVGRRSNAKRRCRSICTGGNPSTLGVLAVRLVWPALVELVLSLFFGLLSHQMTHKSPLTWQPVFWMGILVGQACVSVRLSNGQRTFLSWYTDLCMLVLLFLLLTPFPVVTTPSFFDDSTWNGETKPGTFTVQRLLSDRLMYPLALLVFALSRVPDSWSYKVLSGAWLAWLTPYTLTIYLSHPLAANWLQFTRKNSISTFSGLFSFDYNAPSAICTMGLKGGLKGAGGCGAAPFEYVSLFFTCLVIAMGIHCLVYSPFRRVWNRFANWSLK